MIWSEMRTFLSSRATMERGDLFVETGHAPSLLENVSLPLFICHCERIEVLKMERGNLIIY